MGSMTAATGVSGTHKNRCRTKDTGREYYYANEECTVIYDADGNVLVRANGSRDLFGTFADIEIVSEEGGRQIEFMDKMVLLIKNYDELKQDYLYYQ